MRIFAIESSCDETAAAIVDNGVTEISSVVASSKDFHEITGGIVPEVAARKQVDFIAPVIDTCIQKAAQSSDKSYQEFIHTIDAVAVTVGPGLIGSLVVGVEAAKALALAWKLPVIPVNHLVGHIYGNWIGNPNISFPALVLVVSGGHTDLILMRDHGLFEYIGGTLDDAAGEAFDKTARLLGISKYLGGVPLSRVADASRDFSLKGALPRSLIHEDNFDFSFSGLKTAVRRLVEKLGSNVSVDAVAYEFQEAVVDVLVNKTLRAAQKYSVRSVLLAGGVSANMKLRDSIKNACTNDFAVYYPDLKLCTDNAVYIASAAYFNYKPTPLKDVFANPSLEVTYS